MIDHKKLQDGSYITGIAEEVPGGQPAVLNKEVAGQIAGAFCYLLAKKVNKNPVMLKICVGRDPRTSGEELKEGLLEAISLWGAEGHDAGIAATPAMFMSTVMPQFEFDGAIMITAGHLPREYNGFRFFSAHGSFEEEDISELLRLAGRYTFIGGVYEENKAPLMPFYAAYLRQMISQGLNDVPGYLRGMHIVVDAGSGSAGSFAGEVLEKMGADISGSLYLEPDGTFPGHPADPGSKEAMDAICGAVRESGADLGIIFDADGSCIAAVAPGGVPVTGNRMTALAAALAAEDYPGGTVVTDGITSDGLHEFLEGTLGLKQFRYKGGSRNVINKAKELSAAGENAFLAIETGGPAAYSDNYYLYDGIFLALQIIVNATRLKGQGKDITALIEGLEEPAESRDISLRIGAEDFAKYGSGVLEDFEKWADYSRAFEVLRPEHEGVKANYEIDGRSGWLLLRMAASGPAMQLHIESEAEGSTAGAFSAIREFLQHYKEIEVPQ